MEDTFLTRKHLILMRHGEAEGAPDIERQLTKSGQTQCALVGSLLLTSNMTPDFILCSGVARTQQTLESLKLPILPTVFCGECLYRAQTVNDVLEIIAENTPPDKNLPLIIGHNPTIHETVRYLSRESEIEIREPIEHSYPPATACIFTFNSDNWDMLHPATTQLIRVIKT